MRDTYILFGGQQPTKFWLKDKNTSVFRGDLFQDMYMSMYMFTGKHRVQKATAGMTTVSVQAYFRNQIPAGSYHYPFWQSDAKWKTYDTSNEHRFRLAARGKVLLASPAETWPDDTHNTGTEQARKPTLTG